MVQVPTDSNIWQVEGDNKRIDKLHDYTSGVPSGLIPNGGFVEQEAPNTLEIISYDIMGEMNAANFLARRSLEDMRTTEGRYRGHQVMLKAAKEGEVPTEGPLTRRFRPGNREPTFRAE